MKKFILSGAVILLFVLYVIRGQSKSIGDTTVVAPPILNIPTDGTSIPSETTNPAAGGTPSPTPTPTPKPKPVPTPAPAPTPVPTGQYKNGQYTGSVADAFYGLIQVRAVISGGKLTDVKFLQYPSDRQTSIEINSQAMPYLIQEAIQAQSANVDIVSGATDSSRAFRQSLASALAQAKQ